MDMSEKQKLVVIGNGMAGARTVEEILARGGGEQFDITMFGDEPYGNYNRILLSNVLNGTQDAAEIFLNPLDWYDGKRRQAARPGARPRRSTAHAKQVHATTARLTPTISCLSPPAAALRAADGGFAHSGRGAKHGVFVFRTSTTATKSPGYATKCRKAAVIGGGLLGLEAARGLINYGVEVHVIHISGHLMNQQLDPPPAAS